MKARDKIAILAIIALGILTHGILVLTDYQLWDAWWIWRGTTIEQEFPKLVAFNAEWARPLDLWLYWMPFAKIFGWTMTGIVAAKVFGVISWVGAGPMMYLWMRRGLNIDYIACFCISSLAICLPLFDVLGDITFAMYSCSVFLFWTAWALFVLHGTPATLRNTMRLLTRIMCLMLFFLSFNLNSLLFFYYSIFIILFLFQSPLNFSSIRTTAQFVVKNYLDFVLLPLIYFVVKTLLFPQFGHYANYNKPSLDTQRMFNGIVTFVEFLRDEIAFALSSSLGVGLSFVTVLVIFLIFNRKKKWEKSWSMLNISEDSRLLISGFLILAAAWFPYASVGQDFSAGGYSSRNTILMGLPLAMIIIAVVRLLINILCRPQNHFVSIIFGFIISLSAVSTIRGYLGLQGFGVKQESIVRTLEQLQLEENPTVIQLRDYYFLPHTINFYPPSIWTFLLARSKPTPSTFVFDTRPYISDKAFMSLDGMTQVRITGLDLDSHILEQLKDETTMPAFLSEIPKGGKQFLVVVTSGKYGMNPQLIGFQYIVQKFIGSPNLDYLINNVTMVQTKALHDVRLSY